MKIGKRWTAARCYDCRLDDRFGWLTDYLLITKGKYHEYIRSTENKNSLIKPVVDSGSIKFKHMNCLCVAGAAEKG